MALHQSKQSVKYIRSEIFHGFPDKALSNISFMFGEDRKCIVDDDTLTLVKGCVGSYPNAFVRVHITRILPPCKSIID
ncbi:MAG: fatty acid cis/trans isomerase [Desulfobacteraceae bacterium]|nr:fatty acid cis/trans isomerase [Desulfobacteraceae bacterium]